MSEKFVSPVAPPEGLPRELLTCLAEECLEIAEAASVISLHTARIGVRASKAIRFGVEEVEPGQALSNVERLEVELGDLLGVMDLAAEIGLLEPARIDAARQKKRGKLAQFLQSQP